MSIDISQSLVERDFNRSVVRWIMKCVGNPSILIRLWNGDEFPVTDSRPVACMEFRQRRDGARVPGITAKCHVRCRSCLKLHRHA